jgi:hypothetical protein
MNRMRWIIYPKVQNLSNPYLPGRYGGFGKLLYSAVRVADPAHINETHPILDALYP